MLYEKSRSKKKIRSIEVTRSPSYLDALRKYTFTERIRKLEPTLNDTFTIILHTQ